MQEESTQNKQQIKFLILLFIVLNIFNGLAIGFFDYIPLIWTNPKSPRSVSYQSLSLYSFIAYPHSLKFLIAPWTEIFYISWLGKRKTYILISQFSLFLLFCGILPFIDQLINDINVPAMTVCGLIANIIAALQELAVSGLIVTIFPKEYLKWATVGRSIGIYIGLVFSGPIFLYMNSLDFCNKYFYSTEQSEPILTPSKFVLIANIINILIIYCVYAYVKEVEHQKQIEEKTNNKAPKMNFSLLIKSLKQIYWNDNLFYLMIFLITWRFGFEVMHTSYPIQLVKAGFPKEIYALIETLAFPVNLLMPIVTGKLMKNGKELTFFIQHFIIRFLEIVSSLIIVMTYKEENFYYYLAPIFLSMYLQRACRVAGWVNFQVFYGRIADEEIGSTYITILNSLCNIGKTQASTFILFFMEIIGFRNFVILGLTYSFMYIILTKKKLYQLESLPKSAWKIVKTD